MNLSILFVFVALTVARPDDSVYEDFDKQDNFDTVEKIKEYVDCFGGARDCTPQGADLKGVIVDALETDCSSCTEKQKVYLSKFVLALRKMIPREEDKLGVIFNPDGRFNETFTAFVDIYGH